MSKEIETHQGTVAQIFSYWANLMTLSDTDSDKSRYPAQTSSLARRGNPGWQTLIASVEPPAVELLDC